MPQLFDDALPSLLAETIDTPGAIRSGLKRPSSVGPQLENEASDSAEEPRWVAPTAMMDPGVLARIARVRSDSHRRREFTLDRDARVSVYALGEGADGRMHDYAWLEDSEGNVVWEMTYPMTGGAGGASKNRLYQGTLELAPDDYVLHYKSDDSHAYRDWNASPPHDPDGWGAQIARVD